MGVAAMRGSMRSFGRDASVVKQTVRPGTAKRMLRFAVPYAWFLGLFLFVVIWMRPSALPIPNLPGHHQQRHS